VVTVAPAVYHVLFLVAFSATPGKMAMGLYVGDVEGRRLMPDKAILRYLVYFIGAQILIGTLISLFLFFTDTPQRRTLHDRVAGTLVLVGKPPAREQHYGR
jgi:uncharacterized RDD family membrane protein YckC